MTLQIAGVLRRFQSPSTFSFAVREERKIPCKSVRLVRGMEEVRFKGTPLFELRSHSSDSGPEGLPGDSLCCSWPLPIAIVHCQNA
jgi:hypothetical protein